MTHDAPGSAQPEAPVKLSNSAFVLLSLGCLLVVGGWAAIISYIRTHPPDMAVNFSYLVGLVQCLVAVIIAIFGIRARRSKTALYVGQLLIAAALAGVVILLVPRLYQ